ncbi:probable G-protein coupled receptor Mth-like 5 [Leguminivora glycinivorella]|uniref:probable G-protein coupled receptor Mth-like 5 n=1 Tax=Leguminivora glycinivorella TaxID=1035111 RepID=UPI0020100AEF|nr:probable G-protein coupled receptor Mth-like 5 [Leguminivora glycinivorella]
MRNIIVFALLILPHKLLAEVGETDLNDLSEQQNSVLINKCCEHDQIVVNSVCRLAKDYNQTVWTPQFKTEDGKKAQVKYSRYIHGYPDCETTQHRAIFYFNSLKKSEDELILLPDGRLLHIIHHEPSADSVKEDPLMRLQGSIVIPSEQQQASYTYVQNKYCMDKILMANSTNTGEYALICIPDVKNWTDVDFIIKKIVNPLFHAVSMTLYLIVAIIYFVLPTLRDLAGNIITTINMCLIVSQAADMVRIFTEFSNHISFMVTDILLYISLLGAFFWLNSFGFYIWKTFKSRNVFLRVTDVRKYCYYSSVVWSSVVLMAVMAIGAHFLLDTGNKLNQFSSSVLVDDKEQETIGWLGIAIFFTPVAFTIIFNIIFYVTTLKVIKRINIYGRIHYKLKGCFDLFLQMFLIMTIAWLFLLLSWLNFNGLLYAHVFVNLIQAILIFYVCVVRQAHVTFLLKKSCCYAEPVPTGEWGDEMTHMNGNYNY